MRNEVGERKPCDVPDRRRALTFMFREPWAREAIGLGGLAIVLFPPLGWVLALGYRKQVALRLARGELPLLPSYAASIRESLRSGAMAAGTILVYFVPFLLSYWTLGLTTWRAAWDHLDRVLLFFAGVVVLPPIGIAALPIAYAVWYRWVGFTAAEVAALVALLVATAFWMPSAFLRVARFGRFRAAFAFTEVVFLPLRVPGPYLAAWRMSLAASALALLTLVAAPWGIFWSYLAIVFAFNEVLRTQTE